MRSNQMKRFLNTHVVGQLNNGLFFEGQLLEKAGKALVFDQDEQVVRQISLRQVKWLAKAVRYC
jgi:hypothetical protein